MSRLPRALTNLIEAFERLPGIGPKTAQRLGFYLIHVPEYEIRKFADALIGLKNGTVKCSACFNIAESDPCAICGDDQRDKSKILVVEQPVDVLLFEKTGKYNGLYHVLHGRIDPLNNIGPDDIYIPQLIVRIKGSSFYKYYEIILATSPDMEGEATAMYITKKLKAQNSKLKIESPNNSQMLKITRLARGLPVGASVEFADEVTLSRALEGRREV